jgi:transcriptional regulator with XRE-family HTH domain
LSQKQLSDISNVSESHISRIINKKRSIKLSVLCKILSALSIDITDFFDLSIKTEEIVYKHDLRNNCKQIHRIVSSNAKQLQYKKSREIKLTQEELANKMQTDLRNLQRILSGKRDLHLETLVQLANALEVNISELIKE